MTFPRRLGTGGAFPPKEAALPRVPNAALLIAGHATFILMGAAYALYGPALPIYRDMFGLAAGAAGLMVSAHWVGAFAAVAAQMANVRFTERHALGLLAAGAAIIAAQPGWAVMVLGAAVLGAGYGLCATLYNRRYLIEFGARGPAMVGVVNAVFGVGAIAAPLVLVALGNVPMPVFAGVAVLMLAVLPIARPGPAEARQGADPLRLRPEMVLAALTIGCEALSTGLGPTGLVGRGLGQAAAGTWTSAFFIAFMAGRISLYWVADRVPARRLLRVALAGLALASIAALVLPGPGYVAAGLFTGLLFPSLFVVASGAMGSSQRATSTIIISGLAGGIVMPALFGGLIALVGAAVLFALLAGYALLVLGASFVLIRA